MFKVGSGFERFSLVTLDLCRALSSPSLCLLTMGFISFAPFLLPVTKHTNKLSLVLLFWFSYRGFIFLKDSIVGGRGSVIILSHWAVNACVIMIRLTILLLLGL